jgi:hypothetical protein
MWTDRRIQRKLNLSRCGLRLTKRASMGAFRSSKSIACAPRAHLPQFGHSVYVPESEEQEWPCLMCPSLDTGAVVFRSAAV